MSFKDFSDIQEFVKVTFHAYGYSWQHPRIVAYLDRVQAKVGRFPAHARPCDCLSLEHYRGLAMNLASLVVEGCEPIQDPNAYAIAKFRTQAAKQQMLAEVQYETT